MYSCGGSNANSEKLKTDDQVKLSIEGMTCAQGCGGAICRGLERLDGVNATELTFNEDEPVDFVEVYFDSEVTSAEQMKEKVSSLAGGAYAVVKVE